MATPKKLVHWALDMSFSGPGSPFSDTASSESTATSSLEYINSQLVAHGFAHRQGLSLDGLAKEDADKVVKCLLGMLGQRIDDMSRTEELTTKLRTLSYDHERLLSMYRDSTERAANAEREMNVHKSRLASAQRTLQCTESAHKHTTAELQRTRTAMQALRTAHQAEVKRMEKEKERMAERWNKVSDQQAKLGAVPSALTFSANAAVVDSSEGPSQVRGKGQGFLEVALEQAESARKELVDVNRRLKGVILNTANEMQRMVYEAQVAEAPEDNCPEPASLTMTMMFPLSPTDMAGDKLSALMASIRESIARLSSNREQLSEPASKAATSGAGNKVADNIEAERLQAVIDKLRTELDEAQKQSAAYAAQTQALFDRYADHERMLQREVGEVSVDLMTVPARDEERERLDARFRELDEERKKFTEAAVRLGREKAALEAERIKFLEERRSWQVDTMLAELPPTPGPSSSSAPALGPAPKPMPVVVDPLTGADHPLPPSNSPRRSPTKRKATGIPAGRASSGKKIRVSRRSSGLGAASGPFPRKVKVIPPYETEVIPSPSMQIPEFKTSIAALLQARPPIAAPVFVLPPPSPAAALRASGPEPPSRLPPLTMSDGALSAPISQPSTSITASNGVPEAAPLSSASSSVPEHLVPSTPLAHRPFPMAKPLAATRMMHAYSPAKPSPLSRILMLANSPSSPDIGRPLPSLEEDDEGSDVSPTPAASVAPAVLAPANQKTLSLAAELGVSSSDEDSPPLKEKRVGPNLAKHKAAGKGSQPASARPNARDKGKARAQPGVLSRSRPAVALEKENVKRAKLSKGSSDSDSSGPSMGKSAAAAAQATAPKPFAKTKIAGKILPSKGGARRVPIGSAEAAPVGRAWKG